LVEPVVHGGGLEQRVVGQAGRQECHSREVEGGVVIRDSAREYSTGVSSSEFAFRDYHDKTKSGVERQGGHEDLVVLD
jgi:hypothetical protein